eukprot:TRINITY_DN8281_c0_g1_i2.p1 TRINITY_DN8281_c0_g1~~TRINITY_DN8281_c0_g1_i2.p1  ORF type:complete len:704 (+),score=110.03 TRINITY_DN8281_c0_g1_i2:87-2198(+)
MRQVQLPALVILVLISQGATAVLVEVTSHGQAEHVRAHAARQAASRHWRKLVGRMRQKLRRVHMPASGHRSVKIDHSKELAAGRGIWHRSTSNTKASVRASVIQRGQRSTAKEEWRDCESVALSECCTATPKRIRQNNGGGLCRCASTKQQDLFSQTEVDRMCSTVWSSCTLQATAEEYCCSQEPKKELLVFGNDSASNFTAHCTCLGPDKDVTQQEIDSQCSKADGVSEWKDCSDVGLSHCCQEVPQKIRQNNGDGKCRCIGAEDGPYRQSDINKICLLDWRPCNEITADFCCSRPTAMAVESWGNSFKSGMTGDCACAGPSDNWSQQQIDASCLDLQTKKKQPCVCKSTWDFSQFPGCTHQKGCPLHSCWGPRPWCEINNPGCDEERSGEGWAYCTPPSLAKELLKQAREASTLRMSWESAPAHDLSDWIDCLLLKLSDCCGHSPARLRQSDGKGRCRCVGPSAATGQLQHQIDDICQWDWQSCTHEATRQQSCCEMPTSEKLVKWWGDDGPVQCACMGPNASVDQSVIDEQCISILSNPCKCNNSWDWPEHDLDCTEQVGCPKEACDGADQPWCRIENPGCDEEHMGEGWAKCTPCECLDTWDLPELDERCVGQLGCPETACNGDVTPICKVANPGCSGEQQGGWAFCRDSTTTTTTTIMAFSGGSSSHIVHFAGRTPGGSSETPAGNTGGISSQRNLEP